MTNHAPGRTSWLIFSLLILAATEWTVRGPVRAFRSSNDYNDFLSPYVQTKVWLSGQDPYDLGVLARSWPFRGESLKLSLLARGIPSPYPITGFPLLAPLAALSWPNANLLWQVTEVLFFAILLASLLSIAKVSEVAGSRYLIVLATLAFAPFHTALAVENVALVALTFAAAAIACERRNHLIAGLLLACGLALKPTVAFPAFVYLLVRRQWSSVLTSLGLCAVLLLTAAMRMMLVGTDWLSNYVANGRHLFDTGTVYDFSSANPLRFDLVNAQLVLSQFLSRSLAQYVSAAIAIVGLIFWLQLRQRVRRDHALLDLSVLSVLALVPLYHRFYDAALLIFPVAWAITNLRGAAARYAQVILAATVPFLIPGAALLRHLASSQTFIGSLSRSWWWNPFIAPHEAWLVFLILLVLLSAVRKLGQPQAQYAAIEDTAVAA